MDNKFIDEILGVVVIYEKGLSSSDTIASLQADLIEDNKKLDLFIYDNSHDSQIITDFEGVNIVKYVHDNSNAGVSIAYNEGARFAKTIKKKWILLLDQDTKFDKGIFRAYQESVLGFPDVKLFCPIIRLESATIFSPFGKISKRGYTLKTVKPITYDIKKFSPVNSGMLVDIDAFNRAGGYNEKVKLDFSDLEFVDRFGKENKLFKVVDGFAKQDFSNDIVTVAALERRFVFFCQGAKHCTKKNLYEKFEYLVIVFLRATKLMLRTKKISFYRIFYQEYLR